MPRLLPHHHRRPIAVQLGTFEIVSSDLRRYDWRDPYHTLLTLGWSQFLAAVIGYYVLANLLFGSLYALAPGSVANLASQGTEAAFFFSVETFATVGYGVMAPQTTYGHLVATVEIFTGLLSTAIITGLVFVRFARPRPSVVFARSATIAPYDGVPTLMVRLGNSRASLIVQAEATLALVAHRRTTEGYAQWRVIDLKLERPRAPVLPLAWTLIHTIDETSPLHGMTMESLIAAGGQIVAAVSGTDSTIAAPIHARFAYQPDRLLWGCRFVDMMSVDANGRTHIEMARLHDVVAV